MANEAEVLEFFEKAGWTIVDLVNLSFAEQIAWFAGAEAIAGIHGSGMTNTLWSPRGCKIIELFCDQYIAGDAEWYRPMHGRGTSYVDISIRSPGQCRVWTWTASVPH